MKNKVLIIAEAGVNHNGSIEKAYELVDAAVDAGADIVKFQTFKAENLVSKKIESKKCPFIKVSTILSGINRLKSLLVSLFAYI